MVSAIWTPTACAAEQPGEARGKAREQPRLLTYHTPTSYCLVGVLGWQCRFRDLHQLLPDPQNFKRGGVASGPLLTGTLKVGAAVTSIGEFPSAIRMCLVPSSRRDPPLASFLFPSSRARVAHGRRGPGRCVRSASHIAWWCRARPGRWVLWPGVCHTARAPTQQTSLRDHSPHATNAPVYPDRSATHTLASPWTGAPTSSPAGESVWRWSTVRLRARLPLPPPPQGCSIRSR